MVAKKKAQEKVEEPKKETEEVNAYKVTSPFYDKYNPKNSYQVGDYVTVEDEQRAKDMLERLLVEKATGKLPKTKIKKITTRGN